VVRTTHESPALLVEHAAFGVDFFGKELGANQGMVAPEALDLVIDEGPVALGFPADVIGGVDENALDPVGLFRFPGGADFAGKERLAGPHGPPENTLPFSRLSG